MFNTSPVLWHVGNASALLRLVTACSSGADVGRAALESAQLLLKAASLPPLVKLRLIKNTNYGLEFGSVRVFLY